MDDDKREPFEISRDELATLGASVEYSLLVGKPKETNATKLAALIKRLEEEKERRDWFNERKKD